MRNWIVATAVVIGACASANQRSPVTLTRPDGSTVTCLQPPADIMTAESRLSLEAQLDSVIDIVRSDLTATRKFERIRAETEGIQAIEVLEYRICTAYGNGILDRASYVEFLRSILPLLSPRIGGGDTVRTVLREAAASLADSDTVAKLTPRAAAVPARRPEPIVTRFRAGPLALSAEVVGLDESEGGTSVVLSITGEGTSPRGESILCTRAALTDDQAGEWALTQSSGLVKTGPFNIVFSSSGAVAYPLNLHTTFVQGEPQTSVLRFTRTRPSGGVLTQVFLSMDCYRRRGEWDERLSITSPGLPVR